MAVAELRRGPDEVQRGPARLPYRRKDLLRGGELSGRLPGHCNPTLLVGEVPAGEEDDPSRRVDRNVHHARPGLCPASCGRDRKLALPCGAAGAAVTVPEVGHPGRQQQDATGHKGPSRAAPSPRAAGRTNQASRRGGPGCPLRKVGWGSGCWGRHCGHGWSWSESRSENWRWNWNWSSPAAVRRQVPGQHKDGAHEHQDRRRRIAAPVANRRSCQPHERPGAPQPYGHGKANRRHHGSRCDKRPPLL
jgi:hypothetical protein